VIILEGVISLIRPVDQLATSHQIKGHFNM